MQTIDQLRDSIQAKFDQIPAEFALAFKNLADTSQTILINEKETVHAASTMKTPVMIEVYKQAEQGRFSLNDSILIKNQFKSIVDSSEYSLEVSRDGGEKLYDLMDQERPIKDLMIDMIIHSSNLATNLIIEKVGAKNVTATMRQLGAPDILVLRGVEDMKAYQAGLSNITTAYDLMKIFDVIAKLEVVSETASQEMIDILLQQHDREMIPAKLPEAVKVAHKTGELSNVRHDSGIIITPGGDKYVLVMLSRNVEDIKQVEQVMAEVSLMIYNFVVKD
ncbi:MAG: serine hydrolase [Candidatus Cyclobacteriaceae bacterium M3_2C_046]